jgi:hypothetical protein
MKKPKDYAHEKKRNSFKSESLELLWAERLILEFLHKDSSLYDTCRPITKITLNEFWKFLEEKKDQMADKFEQD